MLVSLVADNTKWVEIRPGSRLPIISPTSSLIPTNLENEIELRREKEFCFLGEERKGSNRNEECEGGELQRREKETVDPKRREKGMENRRGRRWVHYSWGKLQ